MIPGLTYEKIAFILWLMTNPKQHPDGRPEWVGAGHHERAMIDFAPDESYTEGQMAYLAGEPLTNNPYRDERRFRQWAGGWHQALEMDLESQPLSYDPPKGS